MRHQHAQRCCDHDRTRKGRYSRRAGHLGHASGQDGWLEPHCAGRWYCARLGDPDLPQEEEKLRTISSSAPLMPCSTPPKWLKEAYVRFSPRPNRAHLVNGGHGVRGLPGGPAAGQTACPMAHSLLVRLLPRMDDTTLSNDEVIALSMPSSCPSALRSRSARMSICATTRTAGPPLPF